MTPIEKNLVDQIWTGRPSIPNNTVKVLPVEYSGKSVSDKIDHLRTQITKKAAWGFVVTALDEIAWLFNLRGSDIPYNPVFFSYALITSEDIILYIDETKLEKNALDHLGSSVTIKPYATIFDDFKNIYSTSKSGSKLWIDSRCNLALQEALGGPDAVKESRSPVMVAKSIKNEVEMEGFRQCHIRDSAALCNFFSWLENELVNKKNSSISEVDSADKLEQFRR